MLYFYLWLVFFTFFFKGSSQKDENSIRRIDLNYDEGNILFFDSIEMVVFFSFPSEIDTNKLTIDKSSSPSLKLYICETISKYWRILHEDDRTHLWLFSKIEFNLKSDPVNRLVLLSVCFIYPISGAIQYKLGPERFTRLGNSNVLRLAQETMVKRNFLKFSIFLIV